MSEASLSNFILTVNLQITSAG